MLKDGKAPDFFGSDLQRTSGGLVGYHQPSFDLTRARPVQMQRRRDVDGWTHICRVPVTHYNGPLLRSHCSPLETNITFLVSSYRIRLSLFQRKGERSQSAHLQQRFGSSYNSGRELALWP